MRTDTGLVSALRSPANGYRAIRINRLHRLGEIGNELLSNIRICTIPSLDKDIMGESASNVPSRGPL